MNFPFIYVSAGMRGLQLKIEPARLVQFVDGELADIIIDRK